jgi:hypothetical protein
LGGADGGTLVVKYFDRAAHCKVNLLVYVFWWNHNRVW